MIQVHKFIGLLISIALVFSFSACDVPTEINPIFSTTEELLVFNSSGTLLRKSNALKGIPSDIDIMPDGNAVVAVEHRGLAVFNPATGSMSPFFGPNNIQYVKYIAGSTILEKHPSFLTVSYSEEFLRLLDDTGNTLHTIAIPKGCNSAQFLSNGNFLLTEGSNCRIREISPAGETIWESTVPLLNPISTVITKQNTFFISDFDNHRIVQINRNNEIISIQPGYNHPRTLQLLPDGNLVCADSDQRRIVIQTQQGQIVPLISNLNRPKCAAYSSQKGSLIVGTEAFFKPTDAEKIPLTKGERAHCILLWLETVVLLFFFCTLTRRLYPVWIKRKTPVFDWIKNNAEWVLITAMPCSIISAYSFAIAANRTGLCFLVLTILATWGSRFSSTNNASIQKPEETQTPGESIFRSPWLVFIGLSLAWLVVLWTAYWPKDWWPMVIWSIAPWLCIFGFVKRSKETFIPSDAVWLTVVLLIAAFFRMWNISEIPYGLWLDETFSAYKALLGYETNSLHPFQTTPLVLPGEYEIPNLYLLVLALFMKTVGGSFWFIKSTSIIPSLGMICGVYCLGKWAFGQWTGRFASLLLAINSWQIVLGRWGWLQQWYVCLAIFALAFYIRSYKWKCPRSAAVTGFLLGLGLYTYIPIILTISTIGFLFAVSFFESGRWFRFQQFCVAALLLAVVFGPLWTYYYYHPGIFTMRMQSVGVLEDVCAAKSLKPIKDNIGKYLTVYHTPIDYNPRHNIPQRPLLDPITGGLMFIGLVMMLRGFYHPVERTMIATFGFSLLGGILSSALEAPNTFRIGLTGPLICLWASLPLAVLLENQNQIECRAGHFFRKSIMISAALLFITVTVISYQRYFIVYPASPIWNATFGAKQHLIYNQLTPDDLGPKRLYIHPEYSSETLSLYLYFLDVKKSGARNALITNIEYTTLDIKERTPNLTENSTIFIMPVDYETLLKEKFPSISISVLKNPAGEPQALLGRIQK